MRFVEVNDIMCEILGYTREELLSMMPAELLDEEGRDQFRERMLRSLAVRKFQSKLSTRSGPGMAVRSGQFSTQPSTMRTGKPKPSL